MTSVGAVKAALVTILGPALPDSQVIPGPADVTTLRSRVLEVGSETTPIELLETSMTGSSGTERYTLTLTVSVSLPAAGLSTAEDLAVDDFRAAVAAIRVDPSLGINNVDATVTGSGELFERADAAGRSAAIRFPVEVFTTF